MHHIPDTNEVISRRKPVRDTLKEYSQKLSPSEKFALSVTNKIGTIGFFNIILTFTILWFGWNTFAPAEFRFDTFPSFVLWLFISNVIQLFLLPLILIGQTLENKQTAIRAQSDYEVNVKSEQEIEIILKHLEDQKELLQKLTDK
ncbi:MAG TPA: DUF1003 domain-containing protein [Candidatus Paceibacterota bacterium]